MLKSLYVLGAVVLISVGCGKTIEAQAPSPEPTETKPSPKAQSTEKPTEHDVKKNVSSAGFKVGPYRVEFHENESNIRCEISKKGKLSVSVDSKREFFELVLLDFDTTKNRIVVNEWNAVQKLSLYITAGKAFQAYQSALTGIIDVPKPTECVIGYKVQEKFLEGSFSCERLYSLRTDDDTREGEGRFACVLTDYRQAALR